MELKVIENQLIPIYKDEQHDQLVNARELHEFLESKQDFSDWIKNRIEKYELIKDQDYSIILGESTGGRPRQDYILILDTAKEIAMVENNEKGRQARKYFIEVEKKFKQVIDTSKLSPQLQMLNQMVLIMNNQELKVSQLETKIDVMQSNLLQEHKDDWRKYVNKVFSGIGLITKDFQTNKRESYEKLTDRAKCNLNSRLDNLKVRAVKNNKSTTYIKALNYLDAIDEDNRIKEIYIGIVKEYAIKYGIEV